MVRRPVASPLEQSHIRVWGLGFRVYRGSYNMDYGSLGV